MKTFLSKDKKPICKWGLIPNNTFFIGDIPDGYKLCVNPHFPYCIIDIDNKGINKNGFDNIPKHLQKELNTHFNYDTPSKGKHIWVLYTGNKKLMNRTSKSFIDLRTHQGYVCWYHDKPIQECIHLIKDTSEDMNLFLEELFAEKPN